MEISKETVLVTGGSGFLGAHTIVQLLEAGYHVRTTVRSPQREDDVRALIRAGGTTDDSRLSFVVADLMKDNGWQQAMEGVSYVLHTASPFPGQQPEDENELILPARDGTLRVLHAAEKAAVKRVVMTSSFAAVGYSPKPANEPYTEEDWTNPDQPGLPAYIKSKTIAERAAWDFIKKDHGKLELSVINPTGIFGPTLGKDFSSSLQIIQTMLEGKMPAVPDLSFGVADVRDVADAHIRAMTNPNVAGERFIVTSDKMMSFYDMAVALKKGLGEKATKVSTKRLPNWLVKVGSLFNTRFKQLAPQVGKRKLISNEKARRVLGLKPHDSAETIVATGQSLIDHNVIQ
ncbi:dihydroflavonol-4-reductase [Ktedonobacter sp. SOSP1-85]|uniref:SDR family oxidoreductase n=1 Tax=Ktedonobacter sp. SOSP1-85 TaxID=2778367 RepID=UPI00191513BD|nr:aldehyde reductase [Ktedonobacter sp. SOSP1-85]GHO80163.1 dihydroflavonol-4-reductase [Ktedonobacter sp. SOSP1-85]